MLPQAESVPPLTATLFRGAQSPQWLSRSRATGGVSVYHSVPWAHNPNGAGPLVPAPMHTARTQQA